MAQQRGRWRSRPFATLVVKALILLVPIAAGTAVGMTVARTVSPPAGTPGRVAWAVLVLGSSTLTLMLVERLARRLGPLALLLRLSLVFPDQAPKRFGIALRAIRPSRRASAPGQPREAEASLALLASLLAHERRTRGHSERVAAYAAMIGEELGLPEEEQDRLVWAALLHDIGKLEVPARILTKPGALDDAEWRIMAGHPAFGGALVEPLRPWLGDSLRAVDGHHERFDGAGYPYRRRSGDLPLAARIVAVADAFEVMTAARSYKDPMPIADARAEVAACAGAHFDPGVARAMLALSVPKLWLVAGPMSWLAQVPGVGLLVRGEIVPAAFGSAAQSAALATTQAVTAAAVVGGALVATGATGGLDAPDAGRPAVVATAEQADDGDVATGGRQEVPRGDGAPGGDVASGDDDSSSPADPDDPAGGGDGADDGAGDGGSNGGGGGGNAEAPGEPSAPGDPSAPAEPTAPAGPSAPGEPSAPAEPAAPAGGGGGGDGPVGGIVDPVLGGVDGVVGGVVGDDDPVGGIVDGVVGGVDGVLGGLLGGLGGGRR